MTRIDDQAYLLGRQYKTSKNLNSRANLHAAFSTNQQSWPDWVFGNFQFPERTAILEVGEIPGYSHSAAAAECGSPGISYGFRVGCLRMEK